jgi:two-component system nitrate/nitrite response regulator NarL
MSATTVRRVRVLLVDDHPVVRDGLRGYLEKCPGIEVVGETEGGVQAVEFARRHSPDVVLLDLSMPGMNGIEAARQIRYAVPGARVVILTMQEDREYLREARRVGAHGYVLKDAAPSDLVLAIESVHRGEPFFTCGGSHALLEELSREIRGGEASREPALSSREKDVLSLLAAGLASREIARRLRLGVRTVETHRLRLRRKLGISTTAGLVRYALDRGLAKSESDTSVP